MISSRIEEADKVLHDLFGYAAFRSDQKKVIDHTLGGGNSLVLMPTGMGKSLCFQIPARVLGGLTIVISPLIALMKDQVDELNNKGFRATFINSSLSKSERETRYKQLARSQFEIIYVTPERFRKKEFLDALKGQKISLFAIDEAHCISEWGHDFRPDYTRIKDFRMALGNPPTMALTATATPDVQKDIVSQIGLNDHEIQVFSGGLERDNLSLSVQDLYGLDSKVRAFVAARHQVKGPIIVYFSLISTLKEFSRELRKLSIPHLAYHGQMNRNDRSSNQSQFLESEDAVILATPAFGLGINKPDVRAVVHGEIPGSLEAYYQEVGRAGRDGKPAECWLLYDQEDVSIQMDFVKWAHPEPAFVQNVYDLISKNPLEWRQGQFDFLREKLLFYHRRDFRAETAVNLLERWGCLEEEDGFLRAVEPPPKEMLDPERSQKRLERAQQKLLKMVQYVSTTNCRLYEIYNYFGLSPKSKGCGLCDTCRKIN